MKRKIHEYNYKLGIITVLIDGKLESFYLTNSVKRRFSHLLDESCYITFEPNFKRSKKIFGTKCYHLVHFYKIERPSKRKLEILYDIEVLRKELVDELIKDRYYLFLDLEMTMPPYHFVRNFKQEIMQVGYYLVKNNEIILKKDYYVKPTRFKTVSKRTLKFLNITRHQIKDAHSYDYFYNDLEELTKKYNPKIIAWGSNDYLAIKNSFLINRKKPLVTKRRFIDLLVSVKKYYNILDDVGLFKTYEYYYDEAPIQRHNALSDAYILYKIYQSFIKKRPKPFLDFDD